VKILQVVPRRTNKERLKKLLNLKERELRGSRTTFVRQRAGRWRHKNYGGRINWDETKEGVLVAKVQSRPPGIEWQLLQAFVGYLDRHLSRYIESITIHYR
jgi:hypothetical protein